MKQIPNNQIPRTHKTAEELLLDAADTTLTASEQTEMWANLKAYAEFHAPGVATTSKKAFFTHLYLWSGALVALVLMVGTGAASSFSLPGDFLYPVKVDITERALGIMQVSDIERLEYQSEIMHNRLDELKALVKINRLGEREMLIIEDELSERGEDIKEILQGNDPLSVEEKDSIRILSDILADVDTHQYIEDNVLGTTRVSKIVDIEEDLSSLYLEEITDFVNESPEEANSFIEEALSNINVYVTESVSKNEIDLEVRDYLVDVADSLQSNDIEKAIYYIGEAEQTIEFNTEVDSLQEESEEEEVQL